MTECPRNHSDSLYRNIGDGFLEMPIDFCPACGVCLDEESHPFAPRELPTKEQIDELIYDVVRDFAGDQETYTAHVARIVCAKLRDAILASLNESKEGEANETL